jgi:hypothetical protein
MDHRTMRRLWIKAAIEHRVVVLEYRSGGIKSPISVLEVEPDFIGREKGPFVFHIGPNGFWAGLVRQSGEGPRCFDPSHMQSMTLTDTIFEPHPDARWMEHLEEYHEQDLRNEAF